MLCAKQRGAMLCNVTYRHHSAKQCHRAQSDTIKCNVSSRYTTYCLFSHNALVIKEQSMHDIDTVINDLAPTGTLRVAINYGNPVLAQRHPHKVEPQGVSADLARELAKRLGLETRFISFDAAGKVFEAVGDGIWDLAFMAIDPRRAEEVDFTAPRSEEHTSELQSRGHLVCRLL